MKVNEGKVGIYLKYGALMEVTTTPGVHTMAPFVTEVRKVDFCSTQQTISRAEKNTSFLPSGRLFFGQVFLPRKQEGRKEPFLPLLLSHGLKVREISVRPTTDTLREIGTVTKDSIPISFKGVQVRRGRV